MTLKQKKRERHYSKESAQLQVKTQSKMFVQIEDFFERHSMQFFIGILIFMLGYIFFDFIILEKIYLFTGIGSDTINIYFPQYYELTEYIKTEGLPKWSHAQGMGQNIFPFSFTPFNSLLILCGMLFGSENIPFFIIFKEILKIFCGGLFFYLFLRTIPLKKYTSFIGGLLYAFSGFVIVGSSWYVFSAEAYHVALLLLAFELLYKKNSWWLFPIPIAIIGIFEPFNLYLYGLLLLLYVIARILSEHGFQKDIFYSIFKKIAGLFSLGVLISSVFFLSNIKQVLLSPRISGNVSLASELMSRPVFELLPKTGIGTVILRFFSSDLMGTGSNYTGYYNYLEAPMVYCGIFCLIAFTQIFSLLSKREKRVYAVFLFLMVISIIFPFFRHVIWLFVGDYYRGFGFFYSLLLILFTLKYLDYISTTPRVNIPILLSTIFVLFILLFNPYFSNAPRVVVIDTHILEKVSLFILLYGFLLIVLRYSQHSFIIKSILLLAIVFELLYMSNITVNNRDNALHAGELIKTKTGYNDYTIDAVNYIKSIDSGFYRIHKNYSSGPDGEQQSLNDAKVQGYYSTTSYYSYNQKYYIRFLEKVDIIKGDEISTRWSMGLKGNFVLRPWASSKYYLAKDFSALKEPLKGQGLIEDYYMPLKKIQDITIYKNPFFIPLGFAYDKYMTLSDFSKLSGMQKSIMLLNGFVCEDENKHVFSSFKRTLMQDTIKYFNPEIMYEMTAQLRKDTLNITSFSNNIITGTIHLDSTKLLFFTIPYSKGWTATVDGKEVKPMLINIGFMGFVLSPGIHAITLEFFPPLLKIGFILTCIGIILYLSLVGYSIYVRKKNAHTAV